MGPSGASGRDLSEGFLLDLLARASHALVRGFAEELRRRGTSCTAPGSLDK